MKTERRHELKTNTLALALSRVPDLWHKYGTRVLVGLLVVVGVFVAAQRWTEARRTTARETVDNMAIARANAFQVGHVDLMHFGASPQDLATARRQLLFETERSIDIVLRASRDPVVRAEALVYRGDLYYQMATLPRLPGEEEQAELRIDAERSREELLRQAEADYQEVIQRYSGQVLPAVSARFGLAAIAENRREWEQAEAHYRQITEQHDLPDLYRRQAEMRIAALDTIRQPVFIGQPLAFDVGPETGANRRDPGIPPMTLPDMQGPLPGPLPGDEEEIDQPAEPAPAPEPAAPDQPPGE